MHCQLTMMWNISRDPVKLAINAKRMCVSEPPTSTRLVEKNGTVCDVQDNEKDHHGKKSTFSMCDSREQLAGGNTEGAGVGVRMRPTQYQP